MIKDHDLTCRICKKQADRKGVAGRGGGVVFWCHAIDADRFEHGWHGVCRWSGEVKPAGLVKDDIICLKCVEKFECEPVLDVTCVLCQKKFQSVFESSPGQGWSCAVFRSKDKTHLFGAFGSTKFDGDDLDIVDPKAVKKITFQKSACDECVDKLVKEGKLKVGRCYMMDGSEEALKLLRKQGTG